MNNNFSKKWFLLLILPLMACSSQDKTEQSVELEPKLAPIEIRNNQKLLVEFPEEYYFMESIDTTNNKFTQILKRNRRNSQVDTIFVSSNIENAINAEITPDSLAIILEEAPQSKGYSVYRYDIKGDSLIKIVPTQKKKLETSLNINENQISLKEDILIFAPNEYVSIENVYDLNGNVIKQESAPTPKITKGTTISQGQVPFLNLGCLVPQISHFLLTQMAIFPAVEPSSDRLKKANLKVKYTAEV